MKSICTLLLNIILVIEMRKKIFSPVRVVNPDRAFALKLQLNLYFYLPYFIKRTRVLLVYKEYTLFQFLSSIYIFEEKNFILKKMITFRI